MKIKSKKYDESICYAKRFWNQVVIKSNITSNQTIMKKKSYKSNGYEKSS